MIDLPWDAERTTGVDDARLLGSTAFGIPCRGVHVLGEGWDFVNFLADDTWVLRFPKRAECDRALVRERGILERLHNLDLPVSLPEFEHFSGPSGDYPWHFAAYRLLPGTPLSQIDDEPARKVVAHAVGEFLAALHQAPVDAELSSPWNHEDQRAWTGREFRSAVGAYPADLRRQVERYLEGPRVPEPGVPQVLAHADLSGEHILVDRSTGELTGLIDWADSCRMLRSIDFAGLFYEGGRELTANAYSAYGLKPDEPEWRWLEQTTVAISIGHVFFGYHSNRPRVVAQGLERMRRCLARNG